jgi:hypothetical protein
LPHCTMAIGRNYQLILFIRNSVILAGLSLLSFN